MSKCKACGSEIKWIKMASGKSMPCDPEKIGFIMLEARNNLGLLCKGYIPHWATCPNIDQIKKKGK